MGIAVSPISSHSGSSVSPLLANPRQAIGAMASAAWRVVVLATCVDLSVPSRLKYEE
jgi:hypothetical protein